MRSGLLILLRLERYGVGFWSLPFILSAILFDEVTVASIIVVSSSIHDRYIGENE